MREEIASRRRLMGFGHAVYRAPDPRCAVLAEVLADLDPARLAVVAEVEAAGLRLLAGWRLAANVDLYGPVVLDACGVPRALFTATFAVGRVSTRGSGGQLFV